MSLMCLQVEELQRQVETLTREKTKLLEENRKVKQACIHVFMNAMLVLLFCIVM
jgi:hypothetical protein